MTQKGKCFPLRKKKYRSAQKGVTSEVEETKKNKTDKTKSKPLVLHIAGFSFGLSKATKERKKHEQVQHNGDSSTRTKHCKTIKGNKGTNEGDKNIKKSTV